MLSQMVKAHQDMQQNHTDNKGKEDLHPKFAVLLMSIIFDSILTDI